MKKKVWKVITAGLALSLCIGLGACGAKQEEGKAENKPDTGMTSDQKGNMAPDAGKMDSNTMDPNTIDPKMLEGTFDAKDVVMKAKDNYQFSYLGMEVTLPEALRQKMNDYQVAMLSEDFQAKDGELKYALLNWSILTEEQKNAKLKKVGNDYVEWEKSLSRIGALGMYPADIAEEKLSELTRCSQHEKIGQTSDGKYFYYLSTEPAAGQALTDEVKQIKTVLGERLELPAGTYSFLEKDEIAAGQTDSIAPFATKTVEGKEFSDKDLAKYELTMVNVFATWCTACVQEIPDLEKLHQEMKEKGVNVVGIVTDTVDDNGENQEAIDLAKTIMEKTGASYPFLMPDKSGLNGRIKNIMAFPETFFVDKNGKIVGETYAGSRSLKDWREIVEKELKNVKGN